MTAENKTAEVVVAQPVPTWTAQGGDTWSISAGPAPVTATVQPTQLRRPWRTTFRTALQVAIPAVFALGLVVPQVVQIILEETGDSLPEGFRTVLLAISGAVVVVSAVLARIMAIPQVEALLRRFLPLLAAAPKN